ncbi:hypothetical protein L6E12_16240 [Actinokineospora sp. PR83]|nr:hypothetical protein [Actinokineospora sp. PR83]MCG8917337.1 hypothetical protein [Actinokineospora sp. PR83]
MTMEKLAAWSDHTAAEFGLTFLPSGHFMVTGEDSDLRDQVFTPTRRHTQVSVG